MTAPAVTPELKALLRRVKLGRCLDTLPERLSLAATGGMGHGEFLELVLADEVTRRETTSADRRSRAAGLDPKMTLDRWDDTAHISYDRATWNELCSLRVVESGPQRRDHGPRRCRQDLLGRRPRPRCRAAPVQRPLRTLRPDAQTAPRQPARQQPRHRDAPPAARRPAHRRRLRAAAARRARQ